VLSRYKAVAGYDWIAIPLVPYLYAVEKREDMPLFTDAKLVAFLRDRYRRDHLESLIPDSPGGEHPMETGTNWSEPRTSAPSTHTRLKPTRTGRRSDPETEPPAQPERWKLVTANCADFAVRLSTSTTPAPCIAALSATLASHAETAGQNAFKYSRTIPRCKHRIS